MKEKIFDFLDELNKESRQKLVTVDLKNYTEKIINKSTIISIQKQNTLIGFIAYYDNDEKKETAFLTMIAIDKNYQHFGYGKNLLELSIHNLKKVGFKNYGLEVLIDNFNAIKLYSSMGFEIKNENEQHYYMELKMNEE